MSWFINNVDEIFNNISNNIFDITGSGIINLISKNEAINLMQNADLTKKSRTFQSIKTYYDIQKWIKKF